MVGLRYTDVLLEILFFVTTGPGFGSGRVHLSCGVGGLTGKAPAGAGGLPEGFNAAGIATSVFGVLAYA